MTIDILCRVVDNFGDIGVVYRLARALSELENPPSLRLVVDNMAAFNALCPEVDSGRAVQTVRGWTILAWSPDARVMESYWRCYAEEPARLVIEAFACGRPEWLEAMLFDPADQSVKSIINLEYLTAEAYADEFHRMPSLTRSPLVRKHMFMPGFTAETGGLILDRQFIAALAQAGDHQARRAARAGLIDLLRLAPQPDPGTAPEQLFWIVVFGYERDYSRIVADIAEFATERPLAVFAANGKSQPCLTAAWTDAGRPFPLWCLPFLEQQTWDALLALADFSIVRGEDSLSRAALAGRPFLWHAYPQEGRHQLVKVRALLERIEPYCDPSAFAPLREAFIAFNDRTADGPTVGGTESILPVLRSAEILRQGLGRWSAELVSHGNLAAHLMTCIDEIV